MSKTSKPTFVFISGGLNDSSPWNPLRKALATHKYSTTVVELPSMAPEKSLEDFTPDVEAIRKVVNDLVDGGKDVVVVMHSYSGFPGSEALEGLGKKERGEKGLSGGVVRLVYIMSFIIPEDAELVPKGTRVGMPDFVVYDEKTRRQSISPEAAIEYFYHDIPRNDADFWASQLKTQAIDVYWSKTTYAAWKHTPTTFVRCEEDKVVPMDYVDMMLEQVKSSTPTGLDTIESVKSGHFPFLSQVDEMVRILKRAAGDGLE